MKTRTVLTLSGWGYPPDLLSAPLMQEGLALPVASWAPPWGRVQQSRVVAALVAKLQTFERAPIGVGWSLGAMLLLEALSTAPRCLAGIVCIGAAGRFCRESGQQWGVEPSAVHAMQDNLMRDALGCLERFHAQVVAPRRCGRPDLLNRAQRSLELGSEWLQGGLEYLLNFDESQMLSRIKVPVGVVHGREDAIVSVAGGEELSHRLTNSKLLVLDDVGHSLPLECPRLVQKAVRWVESEVAA